MDEPEVDHVEIAKRCPQLSSINLYNCGKIMDASIIEIAKGCLQLTSINLIFCGKITDASVIEILKRCLQLRSINLYLAAVKLRIQVLLK